MRVVEAVVETYTDYSWGNAPRKKTQRFAETEWHRVNQGFQPRDTTTIWVKKMDIGKDGWLVVENGVYGNEPLELFPSVCIMYLKADKEAVHGQTSPVSS